MADLGPQGRCFSQSHEGAACLTGGEVPATGKVQACQTFSFSLQNQTLGESDLVWVGDKLDRGIHMMSMRQHKSTSQAAVQQTEEKVLGSSLLPRKVHFLIS